MKKLIFGLLIFIVSFPIFAKDIREARIFVPPIAGYGRAGDNAYFYRQLTAEVVLQFYGLVRTQRDCDYILRAAIIPFGMGEPEYIPQPLSPIPPRPIPPLLDIPGVREYFSWEIDKGIYFYDTSGEDNYEPNALPGYNPGMQDKNDNFEFTLRLELIDNLTNEILGEQELVYAAIDASVGDLLSILVFNMLAGIPDIEETNDWREKWIFLETGIFWTPRIHVVDDDHHFSWANFGFKAAFEFHFARVMSLGFGVQFAQDLVKHNSDEYRDLMMEFPLALKFVFKPASHFMLEPYGGIAFNVSLMKTTMPSVSSWFAGFQLGVKTGKGMIVIDPRFSRDLEKSELAGIDYSYRRNSLQLGIGYKIGFILKRSIRDY